MLNAATTETIRLLGRCKKCKAGHRTEGALEVRVEFHEGKFLAAGKVFEVKKHIIGDVTVNVLGGKVWRSATCGCGGSVTLEPVRAKESKHECGPKCLSATGPACECACGGKNHGRNV